MKHSRPFFAFAAFASVLLAWTPPRLAAETNDPATFSALKWRNIGPYRGGRTRALCGVPSQPNVFYIGAVNGGVWKSDDYGRTWNPIFDREPTGSIGAIAVAPSDPNIIYVGSGEGLQRPDLSTGDGIYRSTDAGKTWTHLGLRSGQQIPRIAIDPRNPNRLFVAVLGHPYGPNAERGVFRSTDGGQNFEKILYKDENTGANDVEIDPSNPDVIYTSLWEARQGPWENSAWTGTGGGIFKSTDGGSTWHPLTHGFPSGADAVSQANIAIAPSEPNRVFAAVAIGRTTAIYRSDDAGEHWSQVTTDPRPAARIGGGDLPVPAIDPQNPDVIYSASIVTWKSTDGGKSWTGIRGAPGGDDYQSIWINPRQPETMLVVSDQGAIVTVNGGRTWSSWYNQPTAQMYHAAVDNAFPYHVCGGQQESGSACVASRGNDGEITFREWHPVGAEEYGNAVPDPLNPDIIYGGKVSRYDRRTGQVQDITPKPVRAAGYRTVRTLPLVFSPIDPHLLYFAANQVWKTRDGGHSWQQISPDLTRKTWEVPASVGKYKDSPTAQPSQHGVVYALSPSPLDAGRIWAGTDDGLIHVTTDSGAHWADVTPRELQPWQKVSILDAGHFDRLTAYAAINTFRLDDLRPHLYRTHDGGKTWSEIVTGIPDGAAVNTIREDPKRKGLLFAGSEREVYFSMDDGDHWQSLRLNMPATSIRDLIVNGEDLIAATHGRGFWILDDIEPLRQWNSSAAQASAFLFRPQTATRVRWDMNTDTPIPPDEAAGQNPPDGAIIDYMLGSSASGPVTLEIADASGNTVRKYASTDPVPELDPMLAVPKYWAKPPQTLSAEPGLHRFLWDMHYTPLPEHNPELPMQAVVNETAPAPLAPWVLPGTYRVKLIAGGQTLTAPLTVRMDPRVKTPAEGLTEQFTISKHIYDDLKESKQALEDIHSLQTQLKERKSQSAGTASESLTALETKLTELEGQTGGRQPRRGGPPGPDTLETVNSTLTALMRALQDADVSPTTQQVAAITDRHHALAALMARWKAVQTQDPVRVNNELKQANQPALTVAPQSANPR